VIEEVISDKIAAFNQVNTASAPFVAKKMNATVKRRRVKAKKAANHFPKLLKIRKSTAVFKPFFT
jgi:hypothetical protein